MVELATKSPTRTRPSLLGAPPKDLILRVRGTQHGGQVIRLMASKCTVGSGPRCTLRLQAQGVDPVHCLILRGARSTVVRRVDQHTRLNGHLFDVAPLNVGDRLAIGPIQLEVIDEQTARRLARRLPSATILEDGQPITDSLRNVAAQARQQASQMKVALAENRRAASRRVRQLAEHLRSARERIERLQAEAEGGREKTRQLQQTLEEQQQSLQQQFEQRQAELESELHRRRAELDARVAQLTEQQSHLADDRAAHDQELEQLRQQVAEQREQMERQRSEAEREILTARQTLSVESEKTSDSQQRLQESQAAWEQQRQQLQDELNERSELLRRRQDELAANENELAETREELDSLKAELDQLREAAVRPEPEVDDTENLAPQPAAPAIASPAASPIDAPTDAPTDAPSDDQTEISSLLAYSLDTAAAEAAPQPVADGDAVGDHRDFSAFTPTAPQEATQGEAAPQEQAVEPADPLQAFRVESHLPSPETPDERPLMPLQPSTDPVLPPDREPASVPALEPASAPSIAGSADGDTGEDESVEEYMARLMERLRGPSTPGQADLEAPLPPPDLPEVSELPDSSPEIKDAETETPAQPLDPSEYKPRNQAPESKTDLGALRELANTSARSAIVQHTTKTGGKTAFGKSLWAGGALVAAAAFLILYPFFGSVALAGTAVSMVAFLLWGVQAAGSMARVVHARRQSGNGPVAHSDVASEPLEEPIMSDEQQTV